MSAELKQHVTQSKQEDGVENEREPDTLTDNAVPEAKCPIGAYCTEHGFSHGAEAEELREALEYLIEADRDVSPTRLQRLLDAVDARDSLAFLEANDLLVGERPERPAPTNWVERCERLRAQCDALDAQLTGVRVALTAAGIPEVVPYNEAEAVDLYERSLRTGGCALSQKERVAMLARELEAAKQREQKHLDMIERLTKAMLRWGAAGGMPDGGPIRHAYDAARAHLKGHGRG